ncbi:hypothetical protein A3709_11790 [Halioglobus sp. HI00S01]|nr:hypothetical protein A3709_11790 [Halioglobus sp. HI00S01]
MVLDKNDAKMNFWWQKYPLFRVLKWLVGLELAYLLVVNSLLWLPLTQDVVNMIRPEKFHIRWERAWTFYPFRAHVRGVSANGQSRSQQWQVEIGGGSASVSILPLIAKRMYVRNVDAFDVDYRQRPRLKPDTDYSERLAYFPEIEGRDVQGVGTAPRKKKRPWKVFVSNARLEGEHTFWIFNLTGGGRGGAAGDFQIESPGGPMQLALHDLDLDLAPGYLNGDAEVFHGGTVRGTLGFDPFVPRENKGLAMLPFLRLDADLDLDVQSLAFINLFTGGLQDLKIGGAGQVKGRVHLAENSMRNGTDLWASATTLSVHVQKMNVVGEGQVHIHTPADQGRSLGLEIDYSDLTVTRDGDTEPFLAGDSLQLDFSDPNLVAPGGELSFEAIVAEEKARDSGERRNLSFSIDDATLLNMAIVNDYLPPNLPLTLTGGTASLNGAVESQLETVKGRLELRSKAVAMDLDGQDLRGDLGVDLVITGGDPANMQFDLSTSDVLLENVSVAGAREAFHEDYWWAKFRLTRANVVAQNPLVFDADSILTVSDTRPLVAMFSNQLDAPRWVGNMLEMEDIEGEATLALAENRLCIPHSVLISDKAEVAAKAMFSADGREGMIYARYKKLQATMEMLGDETKVKLRKARERFDEYTLAQ